MEKQDMRGQHFLAHAKINKIIQYLTYSDFLILSGWGIMSPFLAVFVTEEITDGSVAVAGFATTIFLAVRSILQIPIARRLDSGKGELDDYTILVIGSVMVAAAALMFAFATHSWHVYLIQFINGVGTALTYPSWNAIFSRHLDKNSEALGWSFYDTVVGLGTALTASLGGLLILYFDYKTIFILVAVLSLVGVWFIIPIKDRLNKH